MQAERTPTTAVLIGRTDGSRLAQEAAVLEAMTRKAQARGLRVVAELVRESEADARGRGAWGSEVGEFSADLVAASLGVSRRMAEIRIDDALALTERLPRTLGALEAGLISLQAARVLVVETEVLTPAIAAEVESRVLDRLARGVYDGLGRLDAEEIVLVGGLYPQLVAEMSPRATTSRTRELARRAIATLDAEALRKQRARARESRDVTIMRSRPGMVFVGAELPEAEGIVVYDRLDTDARRLARHTNDVRTAGQIRADLFTQRLLASESDGGVVPVNVTVLVDAAGVATLDRIGSVAPETVAELIALATASAGDVTVTPVLSVRCPGQHAVPGAYRPSERVTAAVMARDVTCRFPGCTVPAKRCDIDHTVPHPRWRDLSVQPGLPVPTPPPAQDRGRLDPRQPRRRPSHLAKSLRAHLRRLARRRPLIATSAVRTAPPPC